MTRLTSSIIEYKLNNNFRVAIIRKIHLFVQAILYISLAYSDLHQNNTFTTIITCIIIVYFLITNPSEHFFFLVGFAPFENITNIGGISSYFIFLLISVYKLVVTNKNRKYRLGGIICLLFLVIIDLMGEFGKVTNGVLLINLSNIIYYVIFILLSDARFYDVTRIIQNFCLSYIIVIIEIISVYESLTILFQQASISNEIMRFGKEAISVGGAMGIPLYSALVICMLTSYYILRPKLDIKTKLLMITLCCISIIFGTLTISRSFLLTMIAWLAFLLFSVLDKKRKKVIIILLLVMVIFTTFYYVYTDAINSLLGNFLFRARIDSGTGIRGLIWRSSFDYLNRYPLGYLIGYGISNYVDIGYKHSLLFSAMAHNLLIDIIMSVGTIGLICLLYLLNLLKLKVKEVFHTKLRLVTAIPLLVFLVFGLTALSLNNLKTWTYIIMLTIFAYSIPKENIKVR